MKEIKVDIIGSCVTRDAFEFIEEINLKHNYKINNYISKVSIISLVSNKIDFEYKLNSKKISLWENRQVQYDLKKNWIKTLEKSDSDIIILDLIDERYSLYKVNSSYITKSNIIKNAKFKVDKNKTLCEVNRNCQLTIELWEKSLQIFIKELERLNKPIILHKAFWKEEYINSKINKSVNTKFYIKNILYNYYYGSLLKKNKFNKKIIKETHIQNKLLTYYYEKIECYKDIDKILIENAYKADNGHKWGLAPFHYEKGYYIEFIKYLDKLV